jgi:hypothetical protein
VPPKNARPFVQQKSAEKDQMLIIALASGYEAG